MVWIFDNSDVVYPSCQEDEWESVGQSRVGQDRGSDGS